MVWEKCGVGICFGFVHGIWLRSQHSSPFSCVPPPVTLFPVASYTKLLHASPIFTHMPSQGHCRNLVDLYALPGWGPTVESVGDEKKNAKEILRAESSRHPTTTPSHPQGGTTKRCSRRAPQMPTSTVGGSGRSDENARRRCAGASERGRAAQCERSVRFSSGPIEIGRTSHESHLMGPPKRTTGRDRWSRAENESGHRPLYEDSRQPQWPTSPNAMSTGPD